MHALITKLKDLGFEKRLKICAVALLAVTAIMTNLTYIRINILQRGPTKDEVTLSDQRFSELKKFLPAQGVVGFVTDEMDVNDDEKEWWTDPKVEKYYLTQYALAPLIVERGTKSHLVVGNFSEGRADAVARARDLVVLQDFGNGVFLFAKRNQ